MNGDPYRTPQQPDRRVINRSGATAAPSAQRQPEEPQQSVREEPKPTYRASASNRTEKGPKSSKWLPATLITVLVVAILASVGWIVVSKMQNGATGIDASKYQAVSFTDGQLYFGKLSMVNNEYMKLTDVYYLQPQTSDQTGSESLQNATTNQNNFKLIKFTDVIYGPEDEMVISKEQVLFYENIKSDGKVAQLIEQSKGSK